MNDNQINRAELLIQQTRYQEAGVLLKNILSQEPNDIYALALLAELSLKQSKVKEAEQFINSAISLSPDTDYLYYVKAMVCIEQERYDDAENHLQQGIELNPENAEYFALWASLKLTRKRYEEALKLADQSLELDPENITGLNIRSTALLKLNRSKDSFATIEGALGHDPNDAYTHSNYGWGLLEAGDHKKALEHFREALKNNPNLEHAQAGMAEALKARYLFYRLFLKYAFFISNLTKKYQWAVIIGFYLVAKSLRVVAKNNESLQPIIMPLIILMAVVAFSTWVIGPISNLFLRLNSFGKYLLNREETLSSNFVGISLLVFATGLIVYSIQSNVGWLAVSAFGFAMMVPLASMFEAAKHKYKLVAYTGALFVIGLLGIFQTFTTGDPFNGFSMAFIIAFIAFQWVANLLMIKQSNA